MKSIIFTIALLMANNAFACSMSALTFQSLTVRAVLIALSTDSTIEESSILNIENTDDGFEYVVTLSDGHTTEKRTYELTEGPYAPGKPSCGMWTATEIK